MYFDAAFFSLFSSWVSWWACLESIVIHNKAEWIWFLCTGACQQGASLQSVAHTSLQTHTYTRMHSGHKWTMFLITTLRLCSLFSSAPSQFYSEPSALDIELVSSLSFFSYVSVYVTLSASLSTLLYSFLSFPHIDFLGAWGFFSLYTLQGSTLALAALMQPTSLVVCNSTDFLGAVQYICWCIVVSIGIL